MKPFPTFPVAPDSDQPAEFQEAAVRMLGSARDLERMMRAPSGDGLMEACRLVLPGHAFKSSAAAVRGLDVPARLERLLHASGLRQRKVALAGNWFEHDGGPLLAFRRDDGRAAALLPQSPRRYRLVDPVAGTNVTVTRAIADGLQPIGRMIYRPLPPGPITGRGLISYALRSCGRDLWIVIGTGFLAALLGLLVPIMTDVIFSHVIPEAERSQMWQIAGGLLVAAIASLLFRLTGAFAMLRIEGRSDYAVQTAVWDRLLSLPADFFRGYTAGDLANRADGINAIRKALSNTVVGSVVGSIFSVVNLAMIWWYSWKLALLALLLAAFAAAVQLAVSWWQLDYRRRGLRLTGRLTGRIFQLINGLPKWKSSAAENRALQIWSDLFLEKKAVNKSSALISGVGTTFSATYPIVTTLINFGIYYFFLKGELSTGAFLGYNAAFGQLLSSLLAASGATMTLINLRPLFERVRPILVAPVEQDAGGSDPGPLQGRIEVRNLSFRYGPESPLILRNVSFTVEKGSFVAIVGSSGAGKSTLIRLLLGFETPTVGEILYDGAELRHLDVRAVRRQLGVVLQRDRIVAGDILHNIVGTHARTEADAWDAAEKAGIRNDILMLPMRLQTFISEGGATFSGGQLQRIIIARALVNRPPILIFDEATSALDNLSQAIVSNNIQKMAITRLVIAQRLSTIQDADRIIVLDQGVVADSGTYEELMAREGPFRKIAARQVG